MLTGGNDFHNGAGAVVLQGQGGLVSKYQEKPVAHVENANMFAPVRELFKVDIALLFQNLRGKTAARIPYGKTQPFLAVLLVKCLYGNGDCQGAARLGMLDAVLHKGEQ